MTGTSNSQGIANNLRDAIGQIKTESAFIKHKHCCKKVEWGNR